MQKINIQQFLNNQNNKKIAVIAGAVLFLFLGAVFFMGGNKMPQRPDQILTIPTTGNLPDLNETLQKNKDVRLRVERILAMDEAYLFVNYREVNGIVAEILFLWAGMTPEQLQTMKGREAIDFFLRYVYGLPKDDPIKNNPVLGAKPWARLFNRFKARLLMQGHGFKIYDGLAYYDTQSDRMVISGELSNKYAAVFKQFLETRPAQEQKRYMNNFLSYVNETKGFENLSGQEKQLLQQLNTQ